MSGINIGGILSNYGLGKIKDIISSVDKRIQSIQNKKDDELTLEDIRFQTRAYEQNIPIIFGDVMLAGNIIWTSEVRKYVQEANEPLFNWLEIIGLGAFSPSYKAEDTIEFKIDLIIAICEGEVDDLLGIFINGVSVKSSDYKMRFYHGNLNQEADSLLIKEKGRENAPAFRGLCYCVFEDFNLTNFGNVIPKFEFFVRRASFGTNKNSITNLVRSKIKGVNLMPGSGEFVYETKINKTLTDVFWNKETEMIDGTLSSSNNNTNKNEADVIVALNQLKKDFPNLEQVSVVVTWFADGIDISSATIFPASETNNRKTGSTPIEWKVAGKNRWQARVVSKRKDGSLNYGGTVSDGSVVSLLKELKIRGYKVLFYPMIFVDTPEKPWRGRMSGKPLSVYNFFNKQDGYNNFILHHANLVYGLVDVFVIGSEMKGLTSIKDANGGFPAVLEFVKLAKLVRGVVKDVKLTYAADWSEYHSIDGVYNMDDLWASDDIDFIGIDAYFPLTHTTARPNIEQIKQGWTSGEGYDFYFNNGEKIYYDKPNFAWKNLRWFVSNYHINPDGKQTAFVPNSKKIWFTEFGFPSLDLCTNQPNVFFDPTSSESALPLFSRGIIDMLSQKEALLGSLEFIEENKDIIENAFVWCYDLRPFPFYPQRKDIWSDGDLWQMGHWLNGKFNSNTFDEVVKDLCVRSGILEDELEFINCSEIIDGMCINKSIPFESYVKSLCEIYFVKVFPFKQGLKFKSVMNLDGGRSFKNSLIKKNRRNTNDFEEEVRLAFLPSSISFAFIDKTNKYEPSNISFNLGEESGYFKQNIKITAPVVLTKERAMQIGENLLGLKRSENFIQKIRLPFSEANFELGDVLELDEEKFFLKNINIDDNFDVCLEGYLLPDLSPFLSLTEDANELLVTSQLQSEMKAFVFEIPNFELENRGVNTLGVFVSNLKPNSKLFVDDKFASNLNYNCIKGKIINGGLLSDISPFFEDRASFIEVYIERYKNLNLPEKFDFLASFGGEICTFNHLLSKGEGVFEVRGLIRGRSSSNLPLEMDDFLILNYGVNKVYLPNYITNGTLKIKNENTEISLPFNITGVFTYNVNIGQKSYKIMQNGIFLYWTFVSNGDFKTFENVEFKNIEVELEFNRSVVRARGESYFVSNVFYPIDFKVKIV
jgi:hypothetical protein